MSFLSRSYAINSSFTMIVLEIGYLRKAPMEALVRLASMRCIKVVRCENALFAESIRKKFMNGSPASIQFAVRTF